MTKKQRIVWIGAITSLTLVAAHAMYSMILRDYVIRDYHNYMGAVQDKYDRTDWELRNQSSKYPTFALNSQDEQERDAWKSKFNEVLAEQKRLREERPTSDEKWAMEKHFFDNSFMEETFLYINVFRWSRASMTRDHQRFKPIAEWAEIERKKDKKEKYLQKLERDADLKANTKSAMGKMDKWHGFLNS